MAQLHSAKLSWGGFFDGCSVEMPQLTASPSAPLSLLLEVASGDALDVLQAMPERFRDLLESASASETSASTPSGSLVIVGLAAYSFTGSLIQHRKHM